MTVREVMNRLRREGWAERPGAGPVIISRRGADIPPGTEPAGMLALQLRGLNTHVLTRKL